ncbi:hypothetical protein SPRG_02245 [Saprolegnia parasitica CBS 223.65]|uniref:Uncharacterized protein n=1 Tax=Saprolegnia parasitica (strain CBS 223.65) TaxID=695850 RepID=A0A067CSD7_SAPPC|nr:hypothetical protein SPRG_02245 [Saprolegnia parasitica CBS 223.65]KDO33438.1 hypothetical protein SPRG_02245 [Saprolegnia parasitica CBS 223.65]|eukprot:XP_012196184.1 hypothetical protein SPRG_02245 [Saprolegnia parasitica CBS 223.65]
MKAQRKPTKTATRAPARRRPEWNAYLTDAASYQLNQDQLLKKKIQMLTKIPTELPRRAMPAPATQRAMTAPPQQRDTFQHHLRRPPMPALSGDLQKQELQREIDRMDQMLVSLELQANEFDESAVADAANEPPPPHAAYEGTYLGDNTMDTTQLDARDSTRHVLVLVEQLQQELQREREARVQQEQVIQGLHESLHALTNAQAALRDDFKQAVKHIVKLKQTVSQLSGEAKPAAATPSRRDHPTAYGVPNQENVVPGYYNRAPRESY